MLTRNSVQVQRAGGQPERIPFGHATINDWLRILTAEEAGLSLSRIDMLKNAFAIRMEERETFPNAANASS